MEHAKKMILVPESTFLKLKSQGMFTNQAKEKQIASVNNDMEKIMEESNLQAGDQLKLYNQVLQRYRQLTNPKSSSKDVDRDESSQTKQSTTELIREQIINSTPKQYAKKIEQLLNFLKKHYDIIKWDDHGQLIYKGDVVANTNVVDLFSDVMVKRKSYEPRGLDIFLKGLREINTPKSYIGNTLRRAAIDRTVERSMPYVMDSPPPSPKQKRRQSSRQSIHGSPKHSEKIQKWLTY
jgi:hypothetical protein